MKNNIVFKFIAVLLCAASLLGAVGSGLGILALTQNDLYNNTVDQILERDIQNRAKHYAENLAMMYTSTNLGGSPEAMMESMVSHYDFGNSFGTYGYTIADSEGNIVSSYRPELADAAGISAYTFPTSGQYAHLVSVESQEEIEARENHEKIAAYTSEIDSNNTVPVEGIPINHVMFLDANGNLIYEAEGRSSGDSESTYYYPDGGICSNGHDGDKTGYLFYGQNGELIYNSFFEDYSVTFEATEVAEYVFINHQKGFVLTAHDPEGLGIVLNDTGNMRFVSYIKAPAVIDIPATEPTVIEESIPETTEVLIEETIPSTEATLALDENGNPIETTAPVEETAPTEVTEAVYEETVPAETTAEETIPSSASAIPEETSAAETVPGEVPPETETVAVESTIPLETAAETLPPETVPETIPEETVPTETEPVLINGKALEYYQVNTQQYFDGQTMTAKFVYLPMPELTVTVYVDQNSTSNLPMYALLASIRTVRNYLLPALGICLLVFAIFAVYLCTAAGRKPKTEEVRAGGLNRLPLDLYLGGASFAIAAIIAYTGYGAQYLIERDVLTAYGIIAAAIFAACLIFVGFCFAFVAQIKTPDGFWWCNTLCGRCIHLFMRFGVWLEAYLREKGFPALWRLCKKLWTLTAKTTIWCFHSFEHASLWLIAKLGLTFRWIGSKLRRFFSLIPLTWQWMLTGFTMIAFLFITVAGRYDIGIVLSILFSIALILYGAHCFGVLRDSTKKMSQGDLDSKVEDKLMVGAFQEFASDLNDLADVAVVAAQKQLKSERMKTELITNVSHDIKTPLTSIINYVDLLQKPHTDEEEAQYLEVLDRQSQRLKKLIEDLMDMSKASTGNMAVDIEQVNAVESVNQALGEFADKLNRANLVPVFRHDEACIPMMADGKLVWRVLSNLLSNAVKYAMPCTRLYIDLMTVEDKVVLSLKNVSREELNVDAEELMERFVRGDDSRNTDGSGLGLNIAKSLMELQKGQLQLLVDGDLFKVTLIFPAA